MFPKRGKESGVSYALPILNKQKVSTKMSTKSGHKKCPLKMSTISVQKKCPQESAHKTCPQKSPHKMSKKDVHKKCTQKVSTKSVHKKFPKKVSTKVVVGRGKRGWREKGRRAEGQTFSISQILHNHIYIYFNDKSVDWILIPRLAYSVKVDRISVSVGTDPTNR